MSKIEITGSREVYYSSTCMSIFCGFPSPPLGARRRFRALIVAIHGDLYIYFFSIIKMKICIYTSVFDVKE